MNNPLQEHLKSLKGIRPDAAFLARSRASLMAAITPSPRRFTLNALIPAFRMSFATAALSLLIFVSASGPAKSPAETEIIASLDTIAIHAEQVATNATGSIANAEYFKDTSAAISLALTDIADPSVNWGSATKVKQSLALLTKNN